jgi:hypothetical protein
MAEQEEASPKTTTSSASASADRGVPPEFAQLVGVGDRVEL